MTKLRVLDLFCGAAGGWSLGLHSTGAFETVAACEFDPWRRERFLSNNPGVRMYDDVRTLTADRLMADGIVLDVIVGSPPCQDASTANAAGKGIDGERTGLFRDALRLVREVRPRWACFENVSGLGTRGLDWVLDELASAGYRARAFKMGSVHAGGEHRRDRWWIVANAEEIGCRQGRAGGFGFHAARASDGAHQGWEGTAPERESGGRCAAAHWPASASEFGGVDDGLSAELAWRRYAAFGDAVDPRLSHAIGRAILAADLVAA